MILKCTLQSTMIQAVFSFKPILIISMKNGLAQTKCASNSILPNESDNLQQQRKLPPFYKIGERPRIYVYENKYLGVVMHSNLKLTRHIASKINSGKKFSNASNTL